MVRIRREMTSCGKMYEFGRKKGILLQLALLGFESRTAKQLSLLSGHMLLLQVAVLDRVVDCVVETAAIAA